MTFLKSSLLTIILLGFSSIAQSDENIKPQVTTNSLINADIVIMCRPQPDCAEIQVAKRKHYIYYFKY